MVLSYTPLSSITSSETKHNRNNDSGSSSSASASSNWGLVMYYTAMLTLAISAGCMDWKMQRHLQSMAQSVQAGLRLATIDFLENEDEHHLKYFVHKEETTANALESEAVHLKQKGEEEEVFVERNRARGKYMEDLAKEAEETAELVRAASNQTETIRQQILANISLNQQQEEELEDEIRTIHQGACKWGWVSKLCDTVGGITGLQQKIDDEALLIQAEWQQASGLEREEKLESMIADMLEGRAEKFNQTATDLLHVADLWQAHAQREFERAAALNQTAMAVEKNAQEKEAELAELDSTIHETQFEAYQYLHTAQLDHIAAYWYAVLGVLCSFFSLLFFGYKAVPRVVSFLQAFHASDTNTESSAIQRACQWRDISYGICHFLLFLLVVGLTGDYFFKMNHYDVGQRSNILVWFGFLGAVSQTFLLHAIPGFLVECHTHQPNLVGYVGHLGTRFSVLFFVFVFEILMVWLSLGQTIFSPSVVNVLDSVYFCFFAVISALLHAFYFSDYYNASSTACNEDLTVWCYDDESRLVSKSTVASVQHTLATECTPLRKDEILSVGTVLDLNNENGTRFSSVASRNSSNNGCCSGQECLAKLQAEFRQLILPFEVLVVACMMAVLRTCVSTIWNSQVTAFQGAVFVCASVLVLIGAVLVRDLTCCDYEANENQSTRRRKLAKLLGNGGTRPNAVELVHV